MGGPGSKAAAPWTSAVSTAAAGVQGHEVQRHGGAGPASGAMTENPVEQTSGRAVAPDSDTEAFGILGALPLWW